MIWFIIAPLTIFAVYNILKIYGVLEFSSGSRRYNDIVSQRNLRGKKMKIEKYKLDVFHYTTEFLRGIFFSPMVEESHKFYIERLDMRSEILGRLITPEELRGRYILILIATFLLSPLAVFNLIFLAFPIGGFVVFSQYPKLYQRKVQDEDAIIDIHFLNLFLLMYSKLRMGSRGRLLAVVESYIDTLKNSVGDVEVRNTMLKLSEFLLNNLSMYPDHEAIPLLKERYKSATIVNFCNVATQALQGIDNADTLLSTRMDLIARNNELMDTNAKRLSAKANRAVYLIYVILFILIGVGWYSKLPF